MGKIRAAAKQVDATSALIERIARKIEKYGVRVTIVKMFPLPVIDLKIEDRK